MILNKSNCYILRNAEVVKVEDDFIVKPIICIVDEMTEVMEGSNYRAVESIKNSISSIARLGRAAACHLCLAPLPGDLKLNIERNNTKSISIIKNHIQNLEYRISGKNFNLPEYYNNFTKAEIEEQVNYLKKIVDFIPNKNETLSVEWKDIQIGDIIGDTVVIYISEWDVKECIELIASDDTSIEASLCHLFKVDIFNKNLRINNTLEISKNIRNNLREDSDCWICVEDICFCIDKGFTILLPDGCEIVRYTQTSKKKVRCIQTTKGEYSIER